MLTRKVVLGRLSCALLALGALMVGGCDNGLKEKNAALTQENTELHQQLDQTRKELETTQENLAKIQAQQAAPPAAEAARPAANANAGAAIKGGGSGAEDLGGGVSVEQNSRGTRVRVAGDVLFAPGSATLKTNARQTLTKVASLIKAKHSGQPIRIEGYTDTDPIRHSKWKSNEELSQARANAVKSFLASQGIRNTTAVGLGSSNPRATKAQSRRVEIVVAR